jgi:hypothetical protein
MGTKFGAAWHMLSGAWAPRRTAVILFRVLMVAMLGVVLVGPSGVASAQTAPGTVTLDPMSGPPGTPVRVTFIVPQTGACILIVPPPVFVTWDTGLVLAQHTRTTVCDSFNVTITVPPNAPSGPHTVTIREGNAQTGTVLGSAPFTVTGGGVFPPPPIIVPPPPPPPPPPYFFLPFRVAFGIGVPPRLNRQPACGIDGPSTLRVGAQATYSSTASDRDGVLESQRWRITGDFSSPDRLVESGPMIQFWTDSPGTYEVLLQIEDNGGAVNSCAKVVTVTS